MKKSKREETEEVNSLDLAPGLWHSYQFDSKRLPNELGCIQNGLSYQEVLKAHYIICDYFQSVSDRDCNQGVLAGLRDVNLFCSAISRQYVEFGGKVKWTTPYEIAASLFFGLVKNHPFHDGNKRTAFLSLVWFLRKAGIGFKVRPEVLNKMTVAVAASNWDFFANYNYKRYVREVGENDAIIYVIAAFLRDRTRKRIKKYKAVRWSEFETALRHHGFYFGSPNKNKVDIYKCERKKILGIPVGSAEKKVVLSISYPGAKRQIQAQNVKSILRKLKLDDPKKYDYHSIFKGETMYCLVQEYEDLIAKLQDE